MIDYYKDSKISDVVIKAVKEMDASLKDATMRGIHKMQEKKLSDGRLFGANKQLFEGTGFYSMFFTRDKYTVLMQSDSNIFAYKYIPYKTPVPISDDGTFDATQEALVYDGMNGLEDLVSLKETKDQKETEETKEDKVIQLLEDTCLLLHNMYETLIEVKNRL